MLGGLLEGLKELVYPAACVVCKKRLKRLASVDHLVCMECWGKIKRNQPPFCYCCGRHLEKPLKNICPACVRRLLRFDRAFSPCAYEGVIKELIRAFKYNHRDYLAPALSKLMTEFIKEYRLPIDFIDTIIPIPLHKARLREREFNQAEALARLIAKEFSKDMASDYIVRHRHTRTQTDLQDSQRILNVKSSFSVNKDAGAGIVFVLTLAN